MTNLPLHHRLGFMCSVEDVAETLVEQANEGDEQARRWLDPLIAKGPTAKLIWEIHDIAKDVVIPMHLGIRGSRSRPKLVLGYGALMDTPEPALYALAVGRMIETGFADRFHRCGVPDCQRYFVGDPRSRWCSTTCGSKARVRAKRKRDRQ
jgi:hypothetical protein